MYRKAKRSRTLNSTPTDGPQRSGGAKNEQNPISPTWQTPDGRYRPDWNRKSNRRRLKKAKIGTWNVRTPLDVGKLQLLTQELDRLNCKICRISETRWSGKGYFTNLRDTQTIYSSGNERRGAGGVALIVHKDTNRFVMRYNPMNEWTISTRLNVN